MSKRNLFSFIILLLLIASCQSNTGDNAPVVINQEKQLKDSIAKYPDSILLKENLIEYYRDNNNYTQALAETKNYLTKDSLNARFWDIQATLYFENKDTAHSIQSFETAIALNPNAQYIMSLGTLYAETKNPRALTLADLLVIVSKGDAQKEALFIKGLYNSFTGNNKKAMTYYDSCIAIDYTFTYAYREKAICFYNMGKYNDALDVLSKAIQIVNTYEEAYYWMGRCHEKLGDKTSAIKDYQTALQIDKNYVEAKEALLKLGVSD
jgi:tetratricopeptide (TPR) repeat protein